MKYQIWDKESNVIVPTGKIFTAEQWKAKYPIANVEGIDIVCGGGVINGNIFAVYDDFKAMYEEQGCDFSECETKQECLNAIEEFENSKNEEYTINDQTRIADALEDLVVLNMPDEEE